MQYGFCKAIDHFQEKELAKAIGIATVALAFFFSTKLPCRGGLGEANWIRNEPVTLLTTLKMLSLLSAGELANTPSQHRIDIQQK